MSQWLQITRLIFASKTIYLLSTRKKGYTAKSALQKSLVCKKVSKYQKLQWKTYQWQQLTTSCRHKTTDKRLVSHKDQKSQPRFRKRNERCLKKEKKCHQSHIRLSISVVLLCFSHNREQTCPRFKSHMQHQVILSLSSHCK